jgi:hypothetical protein
MHNEVKKNVLFFLIAFGVITCGIRFIDMDYSDSTDKAKLADFEDYVCKAVPFFDKPVLFYPNIHYVKDLGSGSFEVWSGYYDGNSISIYDSEGASLDWMKRTFWHEYYHSIGVRDHFEAETLAIMKLNEVRE